MISAHALSIPSSLSLDSSLSNNTIEIDMPKPIRLVSIFSDFSSFNLQYASSPDAFVAGQGRLGVPWENALADYDVEVTAGPLLDKAQNQHAQLFVTIFGALLGFWRTPTDHALSQKVEIAHPAYPNLDLTIIPVGQLLSISIIAAVLDGMLGGLSKQGGQPRFEIISVLTKAPPPRYIGTILTQPTSSPVPATLDTALQVGNGTGQTTTVSNDIISVNVRYMGQSTAFGRITSRFWLDEFRYATSNIMQDYKSTDDIMEQFNWPDGEPFYEGRATDGGVDLVTQIWILVPKDGHLLLGDLMYGMAKLLEKVTAKRKFEQMDANISRAGVPVARVLYFWRPNGHGTAGQHTIAVS